MQPHYFQRALSPAGKSPRIGTSLLVHFLSALAVHCPNALDTIAAEVTPPVMHYRSIVVLADVVAIHNVLVEIVLPPRLDILPVYNYEVVPVFTALFMKKSD